MKKVALALLVSVTLVGCLATTPKVSDADYVPKSSNEPMAGPVYTPGSEHLGNH